MYSACGNAVLPALGFPIRESADQWLFSAYPRLIAAVHALLRLLVPRHPPCALPILTVIGKSFADAHDSPVIPVGWQPIVAIGCQLAWLCSFQGPRKALRPGLGRSVSQNSTACAHRYGLESSGRVAWPADPVGGIVRAPGPVDVSRTGSELGRRGMRRRPNRRSNPGAP